MERTMLTLLHLFLFFLFFAKDVASARNNPNEVTDIYIVTLKQAPSAHLIFNELNESHRNLTKSHHSSPKFSTFHRHRNISRTDHHYGSYVARVHDSLLSKVLRGQKYVKLYSYHYLINGFAVLITPEQADRLSRRREVTNMVLDFSVRTDTTHTPEFLGLPQRAWPVEGGFNSAGEGIVIGFVDTGIDPTHPSFSDSIEANAYPIPQHFSGICEVTTDFPSGSCNRKLVGARHFAASAITRGIFNYSKDHASPFDGDGHGTHTASIASGNYGIPVVVAGHHFGNASGMAPRSHIAIYKALYKGFGGFAADVVAAIDQAAQDGVDIISLSITPNRHPSGAATFFNPIDMALLTAVKSGIFVVQAAGNTGPAPHSISSFSPWIFTVGAASHDRVYNNYIRLGNNLTLSGVGFASGTGNIKYTMISAAHALCNDTAQSNDLYVGECQDSSILDPELVAGNLLICSYSVRFVLGVSTIKQALQTAKNLRATGVVFYLDPFVLGFQLNPTPMDMPGIIIPSTNDSKVLLQYYNSSLVRDGSTKKIVKFGAVASISGGVKPKYIDSAPKVMYYSARGPDPEDNALNDADMLKPNLVAPGNSIWGAWSSLGTDSTEFLGERFAMMSGTSMAAPHVAGLAALIKKKFPSFSPAAIASALSTTASLRDKNGGPIMAQRAYSNPDVNQSPATTFDMGSGFVNATGALDPGLILDTSYIDYISFLCGINGSASTVLNFTGQTCDAVPTLTGSDLNLPSITIAKLNQTRVVNRTVINVGVDESFCVGWAAPYGVSVKVTPTHFSIATGEKQVLTVILNATRNNSIASYGRIGIFGDRGHIVNIQLSVIYKTYYKVSGS
ncbi:subtilisin-like protease SBT2.3 [Amaranthus tricolor]|uniref:subtilisin-like protease SBT2.3 n=1 Tax=Amaranthus tricolor TaxID=29722 RepID=UPI00258E740F|nr:subtilisin-like protease SBT2.3 [Amaranthus tricolor]